MIPLSITIELMKAPNLFFDLPNALRRNFSLTLAHGLIRTHATDQYIVSYPRSGSTWLRTMLAGIIDPDSGYEPDVFNRLLPGVSGRRLPLVWALSDPRILHSHTTFRSEISKAVYVLRDGRDALISFYHYTTTRIGIDVPFARWLEFYCGRWYGPCWHDHVEGRLSAGRERLGSNLLVVKFDDLKTDPVGRVQRVADFLGLPSERDLVAHAVEMAGIEQAKKREARVFGELEDSNQSFYRGGKTGQYQDYLKGSLYDRFMGMSARAMSSVCQTP
jgi:hypothetical protein